MNVCMRGEFCGFSILEKLHLSNGARNVGFPLGSRRDWVVSIYFEVAVLVLFNRK